MTPDIYIVSGHDGHGPFSEGYEVGLPQIPTTIDQERCGYVGYIFTPGGITARVYQRGASKTLCASTWCSPLPTQVMSIGRRFHTSVLFSNLNFTNTPFEHRYNLIDPSNDSVEACRLARGELVLWGWNYECFIPFKTPYPHGYQGVYGAFGHRLPGTTRAGPLTRHRIPRPEYVIHRDPIRSRVNVSIHFDVDPSVLKC